MGTALVRTGIAALFVALLGLPGLVAPQGAVAQEEAVTAEAPEIQEDQVDRFVRAHLEIAQVRDELHEGIAEWHDDNRRQEVREEADERIAAILEEHGITAEEFQEFTRFVSMDQQWRQAFEEAVERIDDGDEEEDTEER